METAAESSFFGAESGPGFQRVGSIDFTQGPLSLPAGGTFKRSEAELVGALMGVAWPEHIAYLPCMKVDHRYRKRCQRWNDPWDAHELTFSCYSGRKFLLSERTRGYLAEAVAKGRKKHAFDVWAYVIMPEHVHLLIWPRRKVYSISAILKSIKQSVSRKAISWLRREKPTGLAQLATGQRDNPYRFWQDGGGYDRNIRKAETLRKVMDYIHENPVKRGLVNNPEDWLWSSCRSWMLDEEGPISIDKESCNLSLV